MSRRSLPVEKLPAWPRFMSELLAAAYLGVSPAIFTHEVRLGIWPPPRRRGLKDGLKTWDRNQLDAVADRDAGLISSQAAAESPAVQDDEIRRRFRAKTTIRRS